MFLLIMLLTWPPESAILFVNLSLWKEIPGRDIHWSPVAGLSGCGTHVLCTGKYFYLKEIDITLARIYILFIFGFFKLLLELSSLNICPSTNRTFTVSVHFQQPTSAEGSSEGTFEINPWWYPQLGREKLPS